MDTLKQTMDSVTAQTFLPHEYIIMDGGSTDGTVEFARTHGAATHVISESDKGIADAFNKGIALATGDWIGIINSDDWYAENAFAQVEKHAAHADIIHGHVQYWQGNIQKEEFIPHQDKLHLEMTLNHPSVFVKKELYVKHGFFDPAYKYAMDYELLLRFLKHSYRFVDTHEIMANMRYGGASDTYWYKGYYEVAQAKMRHLGKHHWALGYFVWQVTRKMGSKALEHLGCKRLLHYYREHFSTMKKR